MSEQAIVKASQTTMGQIILAKKGSIAEICSKYVTPDEMVRAGLLATTTVKGLAECSVQSVMACIMAAAQIGLRFNTFHQHAYLIPRKGVCTLQVGYRGMLSMAWRSPALQGVNAFVRYKHELFRVRYGTSPVIEHDPDLDMTGKDEDITHAYAICQFRGNTMFRVLSRKRLDQIAKQSYTDGDYYKRHYAEWAAARALKALMKWLPLDGEAEAAFARLDEVEDTVKVDVETTGAVVEDAAKPNELEPDDDGPAFVESVTKLMKEQGK